MTTRENFVPPLIAFLKFRQKGFQYDGEQYTLGVHNCTHFAHEIYEFVDYLEDVVKGHLKRIRFARELTIQHSILKLSVFVDWEHDDPDNRLHRMELTVR